MKRKINKILRMIRNSFIEFLQRPVVVNASLSIDKTGEVYHSNWGDDINSFFLEAISLRPVVLYHECILAKLFKRDNYVVIGSTIDMLVNRQSIVWGAGLIQENPCHLVMPRKICAVRGPKTREVLLKHGIECPAIYGDPALLLPIYYRPRTRKKYKLGIIPHYTELSLLPEHLLNSEDVYVIRIQGYQHWLGFVEELNACEYIVSSSLHGLILAEAYDIPNCWMELECAQQRSRFKYDDFYASIGKQIVSPFVMNKEMTVQQLIEQCQQWSPGTIDLQPLLNACPFELKITL